MAGMHRMVERFRGEVSLTPSLPLLLAYLCGIMPLVYELGGWGIWGGVCGAAWLSWLCGGRWRRWLWCMTAVGLAWSGWQLAGGGNAYLRQLRRPECRITAEVAVVGNPLPPNGLKRQRQIVSVKRLQTAEGWQESGGEIMAVFEGEEVLRHGDVWRVTGALMLPREESYRRHLESQGIWRLLEVQEAERVGEATGWHRLLRGFYEYREKLCAGLSSGMSPENGDLYQSMMLGRRDLFRREVREQFVRSATVHVFAISGLHVMIVFCVIKKLLSWLGAPPTVSEGGGCLVGAGYVLLTGLTPSAVRCGLMLVLAMLPQVLHRGKNTRHLLCLAALLELLVNPLALWHSGFMFSFLVVMSLVYGDAMTRRLSDILFESWRWVPVRVGRLAILKRRTRLYNWLAGTVLAWLGSVPLTVCLNGLIPFGGLLISVLSQEMAWLLVLCAVPKVLLHAVWPAASAWLGGLLELPMAVMVWLAQSVSEGGLVVTSGVVTGSAAATFVVALFCLLCGWAYRPLRWGALMWLACWLFMAAWLPAQRQSAVWLARGADGAQPAVCVADASGVRLLSGGSREAGRLLATALTACGAGRLEWVWTSAWTAGWRGAAAASAGREVGTAVVTASAAAARNWPPGVHVASASRTDGGWCYADTRGELRLWEEAGEQRLCYAGRDGLWLTVTVLPTGQCVLVARKGSESLTRVWEPSSAGQACQMRFGA